jgi:hypothetical protein
MNTSEDGRYIICGYANGMTDVWDVEAALASDQESGLVGIFMNVISGIGNNPRMDTFVAVFNASTILTA